MDELDIKGKRYISSKRASQMTGYAKDYIGQLAREGKILGTRVGRAWYLDEDSLLAHAKTDFTGAAFPTSSTIPTVQHMSPVQSNFQPQSADLPKTWSSIRYLEDDSSLLPDLSHSADEDQEVSSRIADSHEDVEVEEPVEKVVEMPTPVRVHLRTSNVTNIDGLVAHTKSSIEPKNTSYKVENAATKEVAVRGGSYTPILSLALIALLLAISTGLATVATYKSTLDSNNVLQAASVVVSTEYFNDLLK